MIRSFIESLLVHSVLLALIFVGAAVAGSGKMEKPTLITMSTSIIDTPPPGPIDEPAGNPEPTPPEPVQPEPPKPKPKKEVKKPEPKPLEETPIPVEKTVEEVAEAKEMDNATEASTEPIAAVLAPFNPEGRGGGHDGARDSQGGSAGGPTDGVYSLRDLDHRPRALNNSKPNYPRYASENRIEGTVTVSFVLDKKGNVQNPEVIKSTPSNVFESSALTAVKKWKFTPAKKNGEFVNVRMVVAVNFTLEN